MRIFTSFLFLLFCSTINISAQGTWTHFTKENGLTSIWVQSIVEDQQGNIWFGTRKGLNKFNGETLESFQGREGLPDNNVRAMAMDKNGKLWVGTDKGVCLYDGTDMVPCEISSTLSENKITAIFKDHSGDLWIGGEFSKNWGFLYKYDGDSLISFNEVAGIHMKPVHKIAQSPGGEIWIFTVGKKDDFIFRYLDGHWGAYGKGPGLPTSNYKEYREIEVVMFDSKGGLWCASSEKTIDGDYTGFGCLMWFDGEQWKMFTSKDGYKTGYGITSILEDEKGQIWIGSFKGASVYDGKEWSNYLKNSPESVFFVISMLKDAKGDVWLGTGLGLIDFNGAEWKRFDKDLLMGRVIQKVFEDSRGHIWIGAGNGLSEGGVGLYNGEKWDLYTTRDVFGPFAFDFYEDSKGNVWAITKSGISRYEY
jgi:ligand-binding sensor domain-containing protein